MTLSAGPVTTPEEAFTTLPDPGRARSLADLVERLRRLKVWAGDPSYETIKDRVNAAWTAAGRPADELVCKSTVAYCFRPGRRRLDTELVVALVQALHPDIGYVTQWRQALRVIGGEIEAVAQVRVQDRLPQDLAGFTGRTGELDRLHRAARAGEAVVISAIEGMAGVGKTQLAVHAGHQLHREQPFERVLFVDLRGFDPDPTQPPADPAAVLDGFLRLLGMPGQEIPHDLDARAAAYRDRLAGIRALVVLDNAATVEQVRPLLPATPGCLTLVTSRRNLADLPLATHLSVDVFTLDEALTFLARAVQGIPPGADPRAPARIVRRCGYLPLALSLVAAHIRGTPGWTLTDHADRLDERHRERRVDTGVELALHQSYQHLPAARQQIFRLLTLHPGHDFDAYAAAALTGTEVDAVGEDLRHLCGDHLLQSAAPGRFVFHDLVRAYATAQARDEDRPSARRHALTRLLDHLLHTAGAATHTLFPAERHRRSQIRPPDTAVPPVDDPVAALAWLDVERANLIAAAGHAADHGWPSHTTGLAATLWRYLDAGGHHGAAAVLHTLARRAASDTGDRAAEAQALNNLGAVDWRRGRYQQAAGLHERALRLCREVGDREGTARALGNLGIIYWGLSRFEHAADHLQQALDIHRELGSRDREGFTLNNLGLILQRLGRYPQAIEHHQQALTLHRDIQDRCGEGYALDSLGLVHLRLGRHREATRLLRQALALFREIGAREGEGYALDTLGLVHLRLGRPERAVEHHRQALALYRQIGAREGEAYALTNLGGALQRLGRHGPAIEHHRQALAVFREMSDRGGETTALNSLGRTMCAGGQLRRARASHAAALAMATEIGERYEQARAHHGLAHVHHSTGDADEAHQHQQRALALFADLGIPEAERQF
ncbi:ATP-binding protein [Jidongwangia harbinensis]|uniref:ATP-binding protein n=1 Tax=Jidongwangia harbinensis TaxID=2878561 RepID=UPI001CD967E4|nr:tetratricopeptide repeat protein [Jidongwangia harbinensis]MCA2217138.1 tetratricopeptide repeat protein [Jidongwangia harbinensis]